MTTSRRAVSVQKESKAPHINIALIFPLLHINVTFFGYFYPLLVDGGVDAILLWPTYENIGLDDRNQLAMFEAMPGGYPGLTQLHADFHARGVAVYVFSR